MTNPDQNFVLAFNDAASQLRRLKIRFGNEGDGFATFFAVNGKLFRLRLTEVECGDEPDVFMANEPAVAEMDAKDLRPHASAVIKDLHGGELKTVPFRDTQKAAESFDSKNDVWAFGTAFYSEGVDEPTVRFVYFYSQMSRAVDVQPMMPEIMQIGHKCGRLTP